MDAYHDGGHCLECGRKLTWGGMSWQPHTAEYHAYWRNYWLTRMAQQLHRRETCE